MRNLKFVSVSDNGYSTNTYVNNTVGITDTPLQFYFYPKNVNANDKVTIRNFNYIEVK